MVIKVGINGFGRIGRVVFRSCLQHPELEISAINDPAVEVEYICYLIKYDSTHGKLRGNISHSVNEIKIDDVIIKVFQQKLPISIPWHVAGVQYVVEASGMFTNLDKAAGHLVSESVQRVLVTAPSVDVPMIILGVNDNKLTDQKVISCGSSTLYCLAPIVKVLEDNFGVENGFITSIHAMTPSLKPLDGLCIRGKHWRDHRSIHQNIIPATTGACKALGKIIPQVRDKLTGLAFRVPIVNVSVLDLTVRLKKNTTLEDIAQAVEKISQSSISNVITTSNEETVSSDYNGDSHSCVLDVDSSLQLKPNFFKLICWYENEYSYSCRVLDSILFLEKQQLLPDPRSKMTYVRTRPAKKQVVFLIRQTECNIKEESKCTAEVKRVNSKITSDNSQNNGSKNKHLTRPVLLKNPLISHNSELMNKRDSKKRTELFKIWHDDRELSKPSVRENKNSFFQNNKTLDTDQGPSDCVKAQEKLDKVKREFSKMVDITEDLLRKSYNNKFKFSDALSKQAIAKENAVDIKTNAIDACNIFNNKKSKKIDIQQISSTLVDMNRKGCTSVCTKNSQNNDCSKENVHYNVSHIKDNSDFSMSDDKNKYNSLTSCSQITHNSHENSMNNGKSISLTKESTLTMNSLKRDGLDTENLTHSETNSFSKNFQFLSRSFDRKCVGTTKNEDKLSDDSCRSFNYFKDRSSLDDNRASNIECDLSYNHIMKTTLVEGNPNEAIENYINKNEVYDFELNPFSGNSGESNTTNYDQIQIDDKYSTSSNLEVKSNSDNNNKKLQKEKDLSNQRCESTSNNTYFQTVSKSRYSAGANYYKKTLYEDKCKSSYHFNIRPFMSDTTRTKTRNNENKTGQGLSTNNFRLQSSLSIPKSAEKIHYEEVLYDKEIDETNVAEKQKQLEESDYSGPKNFDGKECNEKNMSYFKLQPFSDTTSSTIYQEIISEIGILNTRNNEYEAPNSSDCNNVQTSTVDSKLEEISNNVKCRESTEAREEPYNDNESNIVQKIKRYQVSEYEDKIFGETNHSNHDNIHCEDEGSIPKQKDTLNVTYAKGKLDSKDKSVNDNIDKDNINETHEEQKKRKIILVYKETGAADTIKNGFQAENLKVRIKYRDKSADHKKTPTKKCVVNTKLHDFASKNPFFNTLDTSATSDDAAAGIKQDIYDKLDSASATDSETSFRIDGRKSQVIHITDLTNSLEDLSRLDKICRIIEISDDLSDKLFSPLDKSDDSNVSKKKWSFKDLCERINLDDFCNKVFGN